MSARPIILIADDEPLVVSALARQARLEGLSFISDTSSEHVVELAKLHKPAVILLDIIQNIDGRDLLAQLKGDPETKDIKVVICSALPDQYTRHLCFELGAVEYELKPFDPLFMRRVARLAGVDTERSSPPSLSVV